MRTHIQIVGIIHTILGLMGLTGLIAVPILFGIGGLGTLGAEGAGEAFAVLGIFGTIGIVVGALVLLASLPSLAAGFGLLMGKRWAPAMALIASAFHLFNLPVGTAFAVYNGWTLLSEDGQRALAMG